jgi:hypothetical protein
VLETLSIKAEGGSSPGEGRDECLATTSRKKQLLEDRSATIRGNPFTRVYCRALFIQV